tara:strand:+ start:1397 stop:2017 length:621 start_codon:yes stop_codon:yes gene_type:complete
MVIISHRYKFIYIKNKKVAGSSVESFFGQFCINPSKEYNFSDKIDQCISTYGIIGKRLNGKGNNWPPHKTAISIKKDLDYNTFNTYIKFCVIRNPYDKIVSRYFWNKSNKPFNNFVKLTNVSNLNIHCINGKSVCNYFIRYEHLEEDIIKLCNILGIEKFDINDLPKHKSTHRINKSHYSKFYDDETRKIVYKNHKKEFELFGYKF